MGRQKKLAKAQVLSAINEWRVKHGIAPSVEELRKTLHVGSKRTIVRYLESLAEAGDIERFTGTARGLKSRPADRPSIGRGGDAASPAHGRAITAEEVEHIVSRKFTPQRFAGLCSAIAWILSGRRCASLPSFPQPVHSRAAGIDP